MACPITQGVHKKQITNYSLYLMLCPHNITAGVPTFKKMLVPPLHVVGYTQDLVITRSAAIYTSTA